MDRPTQFTHTLANEILERLGQGEPIEWILDDDHMPLIGTVRQWRQENDAFDETYNTAFKDGLQRIALETLDIADNPKMGEEIVEKRTPRGKVIEKTVKKYDMLGHRKLQIEARWRLLEALDPETFGKKGKVDANLNLPGEEGSGVMIVKLPDNGR